MKNCFKCGKLLPLSEYYVHKRMADGHLGKCKNCTKNDTKIREEYLKATDPNYIYNERKRGREKHRRLYSGKSVANKNRLADYHIRYPEKKKAMSRSSWLKKPFEGAEKHHWSYNDEHFKDVIWLTKKDHMKAHRFIIYDQERKMYRRCDTMELLHTKDSHESFIRNCIETKED